MSRIAVRMLSTGRSGTTLVAAVLAGIAGWLSFGVLAVLPDGTRIGLLPSVLRLVVSMLLALGVAAWQRSAARGAMLVLSGLLVLPWLPLPVPDVVLVWTGPVVLFVWAAMALIAAASARAAADRASGWRWAREPTRAPYAAGILACLVFVTLRLGTIVPPTGDEPHYLVMAESLVRDGDIKVQNNYERGDYLWYSGGFLSPHYGQRSVHGDQYSVHAPGVPAVIVPAFAAGGYRGVVLWIATLVAIGSVFVWKAGYVLTHSVSAAWFGWSAVTLTVPVVLHATLVYPDPLGAAILGAGVYALIVVREQSAGGPAGVRWYARHWLVLGTALGILPWFHTRLAMPAAILGAILLVRISTAVRGGAARRADVVAFTVPPLISGLGWLAFFRVTYGTFSPSAPYGGGMPLDLSAGAFGLAALAADQEFGLLPNAPVHALWAAALWSLFRTSPRLTVEILAVVAPYAAAAASFPMWYAGFSPPARFLVPVILPLGAPLAALFAAQDKTRRTVSLSLLAFSLMIAAVLGGGADGTLAYNEADGRAKWLDWIAPLVNLPAALPSALRHGAGAVTPRAAVMHLVVPSLVWLGALALGVRAYLSWASRPRLSSAALGAACAIAAVTVATSTTWYIRSGTPLASTRSQLRLLRSDDPAAFPHGVRLPKLSAFPGPEARAHLALTTSWFEENDTVRLLELPDLPPGDYRLHVTRRGPANGPVRIRVGRGTGAVWEWPVAAFDVKTGAGTFRLPVTASTLVVQGDSQLALALERVALVPGRRPAEGLDAAVRARDAVRYGQVRAFALDNRVVMQDDGFWLLGGRQPEVLFQPDSPANALELEVQNVSVPNHIRVWAGRWSEERALEPGERWLVRVPTTGLAPAFAVGFAVQRGLAVRDGMGARIAVRLTNEKHIQTRE